MLSVLHFLRSFFKAPEPGAHLPGEDAADDRPLPTSPTEPAERGRSQEIGHRDFETLSHQSKSHSDTGSHPFESASDTASLTHDLTGGPRLPLRGAPVDREGRWGCPAPAPPRERRSAAVPGLGPKEGPELSPDLEEEPRGNAFPAFAAGAGEAREPLPAGPPPHTGGRSPGTEGSAQPAEVVAAQDRSGLSSFSLQKSRSESSLGLPALWALLVWGSELRLSWPHIPIRARGPGRPYRDALPRAAPLGARTAERRAVGPADDTCVLCPQPCSRVPCQLPLGTSCRACAKLCHSAPGHINDKDRTPAEQCCQPLRTLTRAHSVAEFPLRHPGNPPGQNFEKLGPHLKGGTEAERDPRTQNSLYSFPTELSPLPSVSQRRDQYKPRAPRCQRAFQNTPCEFLWLENRLGQDSRSCPDSSCLAAEPVSLHAQEVPASTDCRPEHSPESPQEEPRGTGPAPSDADVRDTQQHLQDISVEAGNQTSNYSSKYILSAKRKPAVRAKFSRLSHDSGPQVRSRHRTGCCEGSDCSVAPGTTPKARATDTSKGPEDVMVLGPSYTESALTGFSETAAAASHCRGGHECDRGLGRGARGSPEGLKLEPKAGAPVGRCTLIIVAVEQNGLQATRGKAGPPPETWSGSLGPRLPSPCRAAATPCESPRAGKAQTCGSEKELPAASTRGRDDGTLWPGAHAPELEAVLLPQAVPQERPLGTETCFQEPDQGRLSTGDAAGKKKPGADREHAARVPGPDLEGVRRAQGLCPVGTQGAQSPEAGEVEVAEKVSGTPASAGTQALPLPGPPGHPCKSSREPGMRLMFPQVTSLRKSRPSVAATPGGDAGAQGRRHLQLSGPADCSAHARTAGSSGLEGLRADGGGPAACGRSGAGGDAPPTHQVGMSASQKATPQGSGGRAAGLREGDSVEKLGDLRSRTFSSKSGEAKGVKTPEKKLRARLAFAQKTFANFFESKVSEKENTDECSPGSLKGLKEKSRPRQSSWRSFLKSKDAEGPKRPTLGSLVPGQEILNPLRPSPPRTGSHHEEQLEDKGSWSPPHSPPPVSPSGAVCPDDRRRSEPAIKCTGPQERGRCLTSGTFLEESWLMSRASPHAQQAGVRCALPSRSDCCLAHGSQGMPSKPSCPKPRSPRPAVQRADFHCPGRSGAISVASLGSYLDVENSSEASERPNTPKARASLLLSLQTLDQKDQKEETGSRGWHHHGLCIVPLLRDLPGSECWRKMTVASPESLSLSRRSHPFSQSVPTGLNSTGWPEYVPDTAAADGVLDSAVPADELGSEEDVFEDMHSSGHHYSHPGGGGEQLAINELISDGSVVCAEALWDHVTMDDQELGFKAGDVIELRVNQDEPAADDALRAGAGGAEDGGAEARSSKDQMRTNVINEILSTERDYIKHLRDICEGYIRQCRQRADMFSEEQLRTIFGNIEDIYRCQKAFVKALEQRFNRERPHLSELGACFLEHQADFQIYSEYCNNHPNACVELSRLAKLSRYVYFFEACRLLQKMIDISLDGFLLTPVQKICKYPLQLAELLKYTPPQHRDFKDVEAALHAMKNVARLINERKRRLENIDKIAQWQSSIEEWEGEDLLVRSSELIYSGELTRVTQPQAKSQQRMFFLFDHQLIYCKKDLLRRDVLYYKGRVDMDGLELVDLEDGKDKDLHLSVKHAFRLLCGTTGESHLLCARKPEQKQRWLKAFATEREQVRLDQETGFSITELQRKQAMLNASKQQAAGKPKALSRPYYLARQKHPALPTSRPQQQGLGLAEPKRKPSTFWHSISRLAPFRK